MLRIKQQVLKPRPVLKLLDFNACLFECQVEHFKQQQTDVVYDFG
ncbi:MAG: hypothetical protein V2I33_19550 [Kangiellaceae bacterium]|nr:hypothetical protein [Kangiellaceae bacterium]